MMAGYDNTDNDHVGDADFWRTRAQELLTMVNSFRGIVLRVRRDENGEIAIAFASGGRLMDIGADFHESRGRLLRDVIGPDKFARVKSYFDDCFDGRQGIFEIEYSPGYWGEGVVQPFIQDESGNVLEVLCVASDITARKMAEAEADERSQRLEALVSALPDLVFIFDKDGIFVGYNVPAEDKLLAPPSSFLGARLEDVMPPVVAATARRVLTNVVLTGQRGEFHYELNIDGRQQFFHARMVPFPGDRVMSVVRNITDLVRAVTAQRRTTGQLEISAKVARMGYWYAHIPKRQIYWSPAAFALVGLEQVDEVTPEWIGEKMGLQTLEIIKSAILDAISSRELQQIEIRRDFGNGDLRYFIMSIKAVVPDDGPVEEVNGTVQDITELRRLEYQISHLQKIDSLGRVASAMAHDFNNMLQVINGYGECLRKFVATDQTASSYLNAMLDASDKTKDLVSSILSFARRSNPTMAEVPVDEFVHEAIHLIEPLMGARIQIVVKDGCGDATGRIDRSSFTQVLMNLAVNSRDAMPAGGTLTFETGIIDKPPESDPAAACWPWLDGGKAISILVSDTGSGIPESILDKIFTPFFSTKAEGAGTGLGLSTAYQIVARHGGTIRIRETGSEGTTFQILLPIA